MSCRAVVIADVVIVVDSPFVCVCDVIINGGRNRLFFSLSFRFHVCASTSYRRNAGGNATGLQFRSDAGRSLILDHFGAFRFKPWTLSNGFVRGGQIANIPSDAAGERPLVFRT